MSVKQCASSKTTLEASHQATPGLLLVVDMVGIGPCGRSKGTGVIAESLPNSAA